MLLNKPKLMKINIDNIIILIEHVIEEEKYRKIFAIKNQNIKLN